MRFERQIKPDDMQQMRAVAVHGIWRGWNQIATWCFALILVWGLYWLVVVGGFNTTRSSPILLLMFIQTIQLVLPVAAERAMSDDVRHPNLPLAVWGVLSASALIVDWFSPTVPQRIVMAALLLSYLLYPAGLWWANRRRRARLLGPMIVETGSAGVQVTRTGDTITLPWQDLNFDFYQGSILMTTRTPRRLIAVPPRPPGPWRQPAESPSLQSELAAHARPLRAQA